MTRPAKIPLLHSGNDGQGGDDSQRAGVVVGIVAQADLALEAGAVAE